MLNCFGMRNFYPNTIENEGLQNMHIESIGCRKVFMSWLYNISVILQGSKGHGPQVCQNRRDLKNLTQVQNNIVTIYFNIQKDKKEALL